MNKILLIEDEPCTATLIKEILIEEGFEVVIAEDGQVGLDRALTATFGLILLDIELPKKDGYAVCEELRKTGIDIPVLMLTKRQLERDQLEGLKQGADDYIVKPFSSRILVARIRARLRETGPEIQHFGDMELDLTRVEVRKAGRRIEMTPLEFKLLATFLKNSGQVLSRDRILDLVWGVNEFPSEHAVDNHILNLRRKLEVDSRHPAYLVSIPGFGYRFDKNPKNLTKT